MDDTIPPPHVVIVPTPGMGHLIPLAELAKRLIPEYTFTVAIPTKGPPSSSQRSFLSSLPSCIDSVFLPPIDLSDIPSDAKAETLINLTVARSLPQFRLLISDLVAAGSHIVALVVDLFGTDAFDVAKEFGILPYIFFPTTATCLSLFLHLEKLDEMVSCEYTELDEVEIPGCVLLQGKELLSPVQDRKNDAYKWVMHQAKRYKLAEGIMVNSFDELEVGPFKELTRPGHGRPTVYPIGPLIQAGSGEPPECLVWLDEQPPSSVLFVSFGSGGSLIGQQQIELALGLEKSGQRFLWVIRTPKDSTGQPDPLTSLPEGFLERTSGRGFLIPNWAPQVEILSHGSTGGFLSHCGWNSTLESMVHGVPLITWPLYAEQKMNAVLLTKELQVGLRPETGPDGFVRDDEIARVVTELMEGEEGVQIRVRVKKVKDAASVALSKDGSSSKALKDISQKWKAR